MHLRRGQILALTLLLVAGGSAITSADAATPASGSVSDTSPTTTWTGGPFVAPNATAQVGDPVCDAPTACDDYGLHVTAPAGFGTSHDLKVSVGWPNTAADFDIYLLDGAGNVVSSAASNADPETMIVPPNSGDYTVRVVPFAPLGQSYQATASLTAKPSNPAPGTATPPGFTDYPAPASLADPNGAGEPSIGNDWKTDSTMYQAGTSTFKVLFDGASPAKATWSDVSADAAKGCPEGSTVSL